MEFGLLLTQFTDRWEHVAGDATLAEAVGLDSVWFVDHLLPMGDTSGNILEAWTALAGIAASTERVRLGHLVLSASFRNPALLAKMAATLDHISGGRLDLGVGAGWYEAEYDAFGYRFPPPGERRRYLEESVDVLNLLFAGGKVDYRGAYIELQGAYCHPVPVQRPGPPIVIGAVRPMMLDLAGRKADTWNCPSGMIPRLAELQEQVHKAAAGRTVRTTIQVPVAVGRTREEADAALEIGRVHTAWMGDIDRVGITGTIDEAAEKIAALADQGVDGLVGVLPGSRRRPDFIEAYGELSARF